jgi:hypothetical protein
MSRVDSPFALLSAAGPDQRWTVEWSTGERDYRAENVRVETFDSAGVKLSDDTRTDWMPWVPRVDEVKERPRLLMLSSRRRLDDPDVIEPDDSWPYALIVATISAVLACFLLGVLIGTAIAGAT